MEPIDSLLSLDMSESDCYYRIRRDAEHLRTVIYVHVKDLHILPQDCQTYGPDVIRELRKRVNVWNECWTTLTVSTENGEICAVQDQWQPHSLPRRVITNNLPRLNVLDLQTEKELKGRVSRVHHGESRRILKICPFQYQSRYMSRELEAYKELQRQRCPLVPRVSAYVFERTDEQIIGFLCEELQGRFAIADDYVDCARALEQLHSFGIVHGDLNKFNIIITAAGPQFLDLEKAILRGDASITEGRLEQLQRDEKDGLEEALRNEEGWGRPWD